MIRWGSACVLSLNDLVMTTSWQSNMWMMRGFFCFLYPSGNVKFNVYLPKGTDAGAITCISHPVLLQEKTLIKMCSTLLCKHLMWELRSLEVDVFFAYVGFSFFLAPSVLCRGESMKQCCKKNALYKLEENGMLCLEGTYIFLKMGCLKWASIIN